MDRFYEDKSHYEPPAKKKKLNSILDGSLSSSQTTQNDIKSENNGDFHANCHLLNSDGQQSSSRSRTSFHNGNVREQKVEGVQEIKVEKLGEHLGTNSKSLNIDNMAVIPAVPSKISDSIEFRQIFSNDSKLSSETGCVPGLDYIHVTESRGFSYSCSLCWIHKLSGPQLGKHINSKGHLKQIMTFSNPFIHDEEMHSDNEKKLQTIFSKYWKWLHVGAKELKVVRNKGISRDSFKSFVQQHTDMLLSSNTTTNRTCVKFKKVILLTDDQTSSLGSFESRKVDVVFVSKVTTENIKEAVKNYGSKKGDRCLWLVFASINTMCKSQPSFHCQFHKCSPAKHKIQLDTQNFPLIGSGKMVDKLKQLTCDVQGQVLLMLPKESEIYVMPFLPAALQVETKCAGSFHKHKPSTYITTAKHCETLKNAYDTMCQSFIGEFGRLYANVTKPVKDFIEQIKGRSTFVQLANSKGKQSVLEHFYCALHILISKILQMKADVQNEKVINENEATIGKALLRLGYDHTVLVTNSFVMPFLPGYKEDAQFSQVLLPLQSTTCCYEKIMNYVKKYSNILVVIVPDVSCLARDNSCQYCKAVACLNPIQCVQDTTLVTCKTYMKDIFSLCRYLSGCIGSKSKVLLAPFFPRLVLTTALPTHAKEHAQLHDIANVASKPLIWYKGCSQSVKEVEIGIRREMSNYFKQKYACKFINKKLLQYAFVKYFHLNSSCEVNLNLWVEILNLIVDKLVCQQTDNFSKIPKKINAIKSVTSNKEGESAFCKKYQHLYETVSRMRRQKKTTEEIMEKLCKATKTYDEACHILQTHPHHSKTSKTSSGTNKNIHRTLLSNNTNDKGGARNKTPNGHKCEPPVKLIIKNVAEVLKPADLFKLASYLSSGAKVEKTAKTTYMAELTHEAASQMYHFLDGYNVGQQAIQVTFKSNKCPTNSSSTRTKELEDIFLDILRPYELFLAGNMAQKSLKGSFLMLNKYKIMPCSQSDCQKGYACMFYHSYSDRRRDPYAVSYCSQMCPSVNNCAEGLHCPYSHNVMEQSYLPSTYKTMLCSTPRCSDLVFCPFVHEGCVDTLCTNVWEDLYFMDLKRTADSLFMSLMKLNTSQLNRESTVLVVCYSKFDAGLLKAASANLLIGQSCGQRILFAHLDNCLDILSASRKSVLQIQTIIIDHFDRMTSQTSSSQTLFVFLKEFKKLIHYHFKNFQTVIPVDEDAIVHPQNQPVVPDQFCAVELNNRKRKNDAPPENPRHAKMFKTDGAIMEKLHRSNYRKENMAPKFPEDTSQTVPVSTFTDSKGWDSNSKLFAQEKEKAERDHRDEYRAYELVPDIHPEYEDQYEVFVKKYNMNHSDDNQKDNDWSLYWAHFIETRRLDDWKKKLNTLLHKYLPKSSIHIATSDEDFTFSLATTLDLLDQVKNKLGWLESAVTGIIEKIRMQKTNSSAIVEILSDVNTIDVLKMLVQKLEAVCDVQCNAHEEKLFREAISLTNKLLSHIQTSTTSVDVRSIAEATAAKPVDFTMGVIRTALAYEGCANPTKSLIDSVFAQVQSHHFHLSLQTRT